MRYTSLPAKKGLGSFQVIPGCSGSCPGFVRVLSRLLQVDLVFSGFTAKTRNPRKNPELLTLFSAFTQRFFRKSPGLPQNLESGENPDETRTKPGQNPDETRTKPRQNPEQPGGRRIPRISRKLACSRLIKYSYRIVQISQHRQSSTCATYDAVQGPKSRSRTVGVIDSVLSLNGFFISGDAVFGNQLRVLGSIHKVP
jgi:hypothetical protein